MVNLLPPAAKKAVEREYRVRVIGVALGVLAFCVFTIALLQLPTYVLLSSQLNGFETQYKDAQSEQSALKYAEDEVKKTNTLAKHLGNEVKQKMLSEYVIALESLEGKGVSLNYFSTERTNGMIEKISIRGIADTRTALASFSEAVVEHELFAEANVPIANLASDKDINFEIAVIPEKK